MDLKDTYICELRKDLQLLQMSAKNMCIRWGTDISVIKSVNVVANNSNVEINNSNSIWYFTGPIYCWERSQTNWFKVFSKHCLQPYCGIFSLSDKYNIFKIWSLYRLMISSLSAIKVWFKVVQFLQSVWRPGH